VPKSLGINSYTYSREQFYSDMQAYIRFKTPTVSLQALLDPTNQESPFVRLKRELTSAMRDNRQRAPQDAISYELRLLGCLVRANLRDRCTSLASQLKTLRAHGQERPTLVDDVRLSLQSLLDDLDQVMNEFRHLRITFADPVLPTWLREVYQYVDEYLSLNIENHFTHLV
jgi:hypothetical protein